MQRKPETPEQAVARQNREAAYLQRQINEGKATHSAAGRMFPNLNSSFVEVEIARRPAQPGSTAATRLYPNLKSENG
jgi:hypothetical protein